MVRRETGYRVANIRTGRIEKELFISKVISSCLSDLPK